MKLAVALVAVLAANGVLAAVVDPADFGFSPTAPAATNAVALQKALDGGHRTVAVTAPGTYDLDRPVYIDDATRITFGAGVVLRKAAKYSNVLVNRGAWLGTTNRDIRVDGLRIQANGFDIIPPMDSKAAGLRGHFAFYHVERLRVNDYRILDVMGGQYAFQIVDFDDVVLDGFDVRGDKDGIHINTGRRFVVRNGLVRTGDDGIALNASDWPSSAPCVGPIEDGVIENIIGLKGGRANFARILTGGTPEWRKGIVLQRGETVRHGKNVYFVWMPVGTNTYVSTVAPTHTHGLWRDPTGLTFLWAQGNGVRTSSIRNVTFRNITIQSGRGFGCFWEGGGAWARSIHPELPEADLPVTELTIDGLVSTGGCQFYGAGAIDLMLRGIRHPGDIPFLSFTGFRGRKNLKRVQLCDSMFGKGGATMVFSGTNCVAEVMTSGVLSAGPVNVCAKDGAQVKRVEGGK